MDVHEWRVVGWHTHLHPLDDLRLQRVKAETHQRNPGGSFNTEAADQL